MRKYLVIIERTESGYSAFCPDLPGCIATAKSKPAIVRAMRTAMEFHLEGMKEEGLKAPRSRTRSAYLEVSAA